MLNSGIHKSEITLTVCFVDKNEQHPQGVEYDKENLLFAGINKADPRDEPVWLFGVFVRFNFKKGRCLFREITKVVPCFAAKVAVRTNDGVIGAIEGRLPLVHCLEIVKVRHCGGSNYFRCSF